MAYLTTRSDGYYKIKYKSLKNNRLTNLNLETKNKEAAKFLFLKIEDILNALTLGTNLSEETLSWLNFVRCQKIYQTLSEHGLIDNFITDMMSL